MNNNFLYSTTKFRIYNLLNFVQFSQVSNHQLWFGYRLWTKVEGYRAMGFHLFNLCLTWRLRFATQHGLCHDLEWEWEDIFLQRWRVLEAWWWLAWVGKRISSQHYPSLDEMWNGVAIDDPTRRQMFLNMYGKEVVSQDTSVQNIS